MKNEEMNNWQKTFIRTYIVMFFMIILTASMINKKENQIKKINMMINNIETLQNDSHVDLKQSKIILDTIEMRRDQYNKNKIQIIQNWNPNFK
jgi:hypothetical protein